ncbi:MAG: Rrf2 family transcriptional regulator [Clostridium sp.]|jgi:Rrf2 family protein|nr:Rrf2 family transcriptional regulator [Clostridium sp.]
MKVSTRGRYALRVMIDLAEHDNGEYIPVHDVANRQSISDKYLNNILPILTKAGFLDGLRGKGGGYKLAKSPQNYTVGSILELVEGSIAPVACLDAKPNTCPGIAHCRTLEMWTGLSNLIHDYLEGITLADLCKKDPDANEFII